MARVIVSSSELEIPYEDALNLSNDQLLDLKIDAYSIVSVLTGNEFKLRGKGDHWAQLVFDSLVTVLVLGFTIYLSFTEVWWWFIIGFLIVYAFWNANCSGKSIAEEALKDQSLYDSILRIKGWFYVIEEEAVNSLKKVELRDLDDSNYKSKALAPSSKSLLDNASNYAYTHSSDSESKTYSIICLWGRILAIGYSIYLWLTSVSLLDALVWLLVVAFAGIPILALVLELFLKSLMRTYIGSIQLIIKIRSKLKK